jgi:preprotein translocase subunit SecA
VVSRLSHLEIHIEAPPQMAPAPPTRKMFESRQDPAMSRGPILASEPPAPKVGRNEPCPCGSGKKYKHCHGVLA